MHNDRQRHTQNEPFGRPHRLCQGPERGPERRCPDHRAQDSGMHHGPGRNRQRCLPREPFRTADHPRFHPSRGDAGGHAHQPAGTLHARPSGHRCDTQEQGCPSCRYPTALGHLNRGRQGILRHTRRLCRVRDQPGPRTPGRRNPCRKAACRLSRSSSAN